MSLDIWKNSTNNFEDKKKPTETIGFFFCYRIWWMKEFTLNRFFTTFVTLIFKLFYELVDFLHETLI